MAFAIPALSTPADVETAPRRRGFFARAYDAIIEARRREAELYVLRRAGITDRLTDEGERRIDDILFRSGRPLL